MLSIKNIHPVEGKHHSPEVKYNVVVNYMATGNLKIAAASVGIPYETVRKWHQMDWWKEYEFDIANAKKTETSNKLSKIVDKSLALLEDRLDNGDYVVNQKTGEVCRRPVQIRDINQVMNNVLLRQESIDKQRRDQPTRKEESIHDLLKTLAAEFSKFNGKKAPEIIDVEDATVKDEDDAIQTLPEMPRDEGTELISPSDPQKDW